MGPYWSWRAKPLFRMKKITFFLCLLFVVGLVQAQEDDSDSLCLPPEINAFFPKIAAKFLIGTASFYHKSFEGRPTSTGEIFRNNKFTAASNHFSLNTWLRVINLNNQKSIIIRVNDRMHPRMAKKGRVVDLSRVGAKALGFISSGLTRVRVEVVPKGTLE